MNYKIYQVDAFADHVFSGNPAAVVPLSEWLSDELLLKIASENNLSETASYIINNDLVEIRWFTPIPFYSHRSGHLPVQINHKDRVEITGKAVLYMKGEIHI